MFRKKRTHEDLEIQPHNPAMLKTPTQIRLDKIYEAYHYSKTLTLKELYYIAYQDPEFYQRILRILLMMDDSETESTAYEYLEHLERDIEETEKSIDRSMNREAVVTLQNVKESLLNVRSMVSKMHDSELSDLVDNLYKASELRKQYSDEIEGWRMFLNETILFYGEQPEIESKKEFYA